MTPPAGDVPAAWGPHLPVPDAETEPFWAAARDGRLAIQRCRACERPFVYPRSACPRCWSAELEWIDASGRGSVYSFTVIRHNDVPPFREMVPYVVALVDLEEGVRLTANIVGCRPEEVRVGMPVEVSYQRLTGEITLPQFMPREG